MADTDDRKLALIARLATQRARLSRHADYVRESLNVGHRVKAGFVKNPVMWLGGAAFVGVVLARLRGGKAVKQTPVGAPPRAAARAEFMWPSLKFVFDLARPALVSMLTARIADFASGRMASRRDGRR